MIFGGKNSVILLLLEQLIQSGIWIPKLVQYNLLFLFSLAVGPDPGSMGSGRTDVLTQPSRLHIPRGRTSQLSSDHWLVVEGCRKEDATN